MSRRYVNRHLVESEPIHLYADTIAPVQRTRPDELFVIRIMARPGPDSPEPADTAGAFVNCWVDVDDFRTAELRAVATIQEEGWLPERFESWELVCRECYLEADEHESLERVEEAFRAGGACTFFCWSHDAPDASDEH